MAGAIAELACFTLARDFRNIDPSFARVLLVEAADHLLWALPTELSTYAKREQCRRRSLSRHNRSGPICARCQRRTFAVLDCATAASASRLRKWTVALQCGSSQAANP